MFLIEAIFRNNNETSYFASIETLTYIQTYSRIFMQKNGLSKIICDNDKIGFCHDKIKVLTLIYNKNYSRLLILNFVTGKIINENKKFFFCHYNLPNCNFDSWSKLFTNIDVKQWYKKNYLWKLEAHFSSW